MYIEWFSYLFTIRVSSETAVLNSFNNKMLLVRKTTRTFYVAREYKIVLGTVNPRYFALVGHQSVWLFEACIRSKENKYFERSVVRMIFYTECVQTNARLSILSRESTLTGCTQPNQISCFKIITILVSLVSTSFRDSQIIVWFKTRVFAPSSNH